MGAKVNLTNNQYELTILNCDKTLYALKDLIGEYYFDNYQTILYKIQESRIFKEKKVPSICDENYLRETLKMSQEIIEKIDMGNIRVLNGLVVNYFRSYVNYDHRIVQFSDDYILDPGDYEVVYFKFLCLMMHKIRFPEIDDALSFHLNKHEDKTKFFKKLKDYYIDLPKGIKDVDIKERIWEWIESESKNFAPKPILEIDTLLRELNKLGFSDLIKVNCLSKGQKEKLVKLLINNNMPYRIAMLHYLEFIKESLNYFKKPIQRNTKIAEIFQYQSGERAVNGLIKSLHKPSSRYNADYYVSTAKTDFSDILGTK